MGNVFDYLTWRGDLSFEQSPFNEVDNLVLCCLSYVPFDGIAPRECEKAITIRQAAEAFFAADSQERVLRADDDGKLLAAAAETVRYSGVQLLCYRNEIDLKLEKQFSAICFRGVGEMDYVAFRGTDNTIIGWKEDFNMSFMSPVPAQTAAAAYLRDVSGHLSAKFLVGGHSKGGNLAVYAPAFNSPDLQKRVAAIFNNDGPGFPEKVVLSDGYLAIYERVSTFVPQSSIVGMLLEHTENYTVIHSTQTGVLQHDPYSWEILGAKLVRLKTVTKSSERVDKTMREWMYGMTDEQREGFFDALYMLMEATGARTMQELSVDWVHSTGEVIKTLKNVDEPTRALLAKMIALFLKLLKKNLTEGIAKNPMDFVQRKLDAIKKPDNSKDSPQLLELISGEKSEE